MINWKAVAEVLGVLGGYLLVLAICYGPYVSAKRRKARSGDVMPTGRLVLPASELKPDGFTRQGHPKFRIDGVSRFKR